MRRSGGNQARAAEILGISRYALRRRLVGENALKGSLPFP